MFGAGAVLTLPVGVDAQEEFVVGSGRADAAVVRVGPSAGKLAIAPTVGLALADFLGTLGRGEARMADLGALDVALPPEIKNLIPIVTARSTDEVPEQASTFGGTPAGTPVTVGAIEQKAKASKAPSGESTVSVGTVSIPNLIEVAGGQARSSARVVDNKTREARGVSHIASISLGGGIVTLRGLTWEAVQRTGEGETLEASFRIEGATIAGRNLTIPAGGEELRTVFEPINRALAPTGLVLDAPRVVTDNGVARITPLGVRIVNSPLGQALVAPVIGAAQPIREPVTAALIQNCPDCGIAILLADVVLGVVSGGGRLDLELGGASGTTEGESFSSPFDFDFAPSLGGSGPSNDLAGDVGGTASFGDATRSTSSGSTFADAGTGAAASLPAVTGPSTAASGGAARSTGPAAATLAAADEGVDGETGGVAAVVGLFGLLGACALAAADYRAIRAARRTIPTV